MRIIVTGDDFGYSEETVDATIEGFRNGSPTSASIMANMPESQRALDFARDHPEFSYGVHLTLGSDGDVMPVLAASQLPGLVTDGGQFLPARRVRWMAAMGLLPTKQLAAEISAQIARVRDAGVAVSYVDSHGHLHKYPVVREILQTVLPRFAITRVRTAQNLHLCPTWKSPTRWMGGRWASQISRGFKSTAALYMPRGPGDGVWPRELLRTAARKTTLEVGIHPGYAGWRNDQRLQSHEFANAAKGQGHTLIGWKDL